MGSPHDHGGEEQVVAPAVLGETQQETAVFVPAEPVSVDDQHARLELRWTTEGALALLTFTSLERLVEGCGEQQPWIAVPEAEVMAMARQAGAQVVLEDVPLPDDDVRAQQEE